MIGRLSRRAKQIKCDSAERELVALIKQNGGFDFSCKISRPWFRCLRSTVERCRVARRKKSVEPGDIVYKLDIIPLRDDLRIRLPPQRDSANMVCVSVGRNDVFDR